jgi:hypothetical protein
MGKNRGVTMDLRHKLDNLINRDMDKTPEQKYEGLVDFISSIETEARTDERDNFFKLCQNLFRKPEEWKTDMNKPVLQRRYSEQATSYNQALWDIQMAIHHPDLEEKNL